MSKLSIRWGIVIAALVTLALPATALPAPQSSEPCANVSISLSPPVVPRGRHGHGCRFDRELFYRTPALHDQIRADHSLYARGAALLPGHVRSGSVILCELLFPHTVVLLPR